MMYYIVKCRKGEENMLITKSHVIKYISMQINTHIARLIINGIFTDYILLPSNVKLLVLLYSYYIVLIIVISRPNYRDWWTTLFIAISTKIN